SFRILTICDSLYRDFFMSFSVCLIVGRRTLITHAPILGDGYKSARQVTCTLGLQSGQVLADSLNSLLGTIDIEELDLLGIPLADPLAFIVDALSGIVDIVVGPILEYVLGPLLDFLGVSLGQAKLNLLKSEQSTVQLLQYCGPEGC
ncbi:hypothetical protein, partial [Alloalcanivorax xenomutans]|uniref:hypothetical protein n=1 Tax=Alloalcanivorax xenomutans TaxID=1094342 RepID=UPI001F313E13